MDNRIEIHPEKNKETEFLYPSFYSEIFRLISFNPTLLSLSEDNVLSIKLPKNPSLEMREKTINYINTIILDSAGLTEEQAKKSNEIASRSQPLIPNGNSNTRLLASSKNIESSLSETKLIHKKSAMTIAATQRCYELLSTNAVNSFFRFFMSMLEAQIDIFAKCILRKNKPNQSTITMLTMNIVTKCFYDSLYAMTQEKTKQSYIRKLTDLEQQKEKLPLSILHRCVGDVLNGIGKILEDKNVYYFDIFDSAKRDRCDAYAEEISRFFFAAKNSEFGTIDDLKKTAHTDDINSIDERAYFMNLLQTLQDTFLHVTTTIEGAKKADMIILQFLIELRKAFYVQAPSNKTGAMIQTSICKAANVIINGDKDDSVYNVDENNKALDKMYGITLMKNMKKKVNESDNK